MDKREAIRRGRKPASESRAPEFRAKLLTWRQTPEAQRVSLRALAREIGASHQLLSFHFRRLDKWQMKEYQKKAQEIRSRAIAERRSITPEEEMQCDIYAKESLAVMTDSLVSKMLTELRKQLKRGKLTGIYDRLAKMLASKGYREAQEILGIHFQRKNNLPVIVSSRAKSFRCD
jgi:hypothetical protein